MKSVIILLTLSIFNFFLVQEASSGSARLIAPSRSNYDGAITNMYKKPPPKKQGYYDEDDTDATFFPGNAMLLFQLKAAIQSSLHKVEDDEDSLRRIKDEITLLKGLSEMLFSFFEDAVEGLMTNCTYLPGPTLPPPIKVGNKCYSISDVTPGSVANLDYAAARQLCLEHGGDLANPYLLKGGTFGRDVEEALEEAKEEGLITGGGAAPNYWIGGTDVQNPGFITTLNGFKIPNDSAKYFDVSTFPYVVPQVIPVDTDVYGLTIVGPLPAIEHDWYIAPKVATTPLPCICEFNTAIDITAMALDLEDKFRANKSPLIQNFLRKVRLIQKRKSEMSKPLLDSARQKTTQSIIDVVSKEPERAKITENVENEKKIQEIKSDQETKTDEVVKKIENTKIVEGLPAVVKKENPLETNKDKPLEAKKDKPLETKKDNPLETKKDNPLETKKDKPIETEKVLNKEGTKIEDELPKRQGEITPNKEVVTEDDKNVNEKKILLEDILGKLEQLESFRAFTQ